MREIYISFSLSLFLSQDKCLVSYQACPCCLALIACCMLCSPSEVKERRKGEERAINFYNFLLSPPKAQMSGVTFHLIATDRSNIRRIQVTLLQSIKIVKKCDHSSVFLIHLTQFFYIFVDMVRCRLDCSESS